MAEIIYDDSNLQRLWAELDPKNRKKALKGALRKCANMVKKAAQQRVPSYFKNAENNPAKGILAKVYKEKAVGFKVYVSPGSKKRGSKLNSKAMHINRQGKEKPVLFWASLGTSERSTKGRRILGIIWRKKAARRGRMPRYTFLRDADREKGSQVQTTLREAIVSNVIKTAKKYGCKV